jgi:protoheme IX farnesyltransferase
MALRDDYEAAQVPMLPLLIGDRRAAWVIFAHTVVLVLLALVPAMYGMGWLYLAGAAIGGAMFVRTGIHLVRKPGQQAAMRNFHASLLQLTLLLVGAIADRWLLPTSLPL